MTIFPTVCQSWRKSFLQRIGLLVNTVISTLDFDGTSEVLISEVTQHTWTNVKVVEWLTGVRFNLEGEIDHSGKLEVKGLSLAC